MQGWASVALLSGDQENLSINKQRSRVFDNLRYEGVASRDGNKSGVTSRSKLFYGE